MGNLNNKYWDSQIEDDDIYFDDQEAWDSLDDAFDDLIEKLKKKDRKKKKALKKMRKEK